MADEKSHTGIWVASIGAIATVATAVVAGYFSLKDGGEDKNGAREQPQSAASGVIVMVPGADWAWVYGSPVANLGANRLGQISTGQQIEIVCTVQGPAAKGPGGVTTIWDKIRFNDGYGFVNDAYVDTGSNLPVAPNCE